MIVLNKNSYSAQKKRKKERYTESFGFMIGLIQSLDCVAGKFLQIGIRFYSYINSLAVLIWD